MKNIKRIQKPIFSYRGNRFETLEEVTECIGQQIKSLSNDFLVGEICPNEMIDWCNELQSLVSDLSDVIHEMQKDGKVPSESLCCEDCGTDENVSIGPCPYRLEINNDESPVALCSDCYHDRVMDI